MIQVGINAKNVVPIEELTDHEDASIPGVYLVEMGDDCPQSKIPTVALDTFHESYGIETLDEFEFSVFDLKSGIALCEEELAESYSSDTSRCSVEKLADIPLSTYEVELRVSSGAATSVQHFLLAESEHDACTKALQAAKDGVRGDPSAIGATYTASATRVRS